MTFMEGKYQAYERMMQQIPGNKNRGGGRRVFRYTLADLDCHYCKEKKECRGECLCPYIFGNLNDLMRDPAFISAVDNAESCDTPHKETLIFLKSNREMSCAFEKITNTQRQEREYATGLRRRT